MVRKEFRKSYLMTGDVVVSAGGYTGVILRGTPSGDLIKWFRDENGTIIKLVRKLTTVSEDLIYSNGNKRIVKVYRTTNEHDLTTVDVVKAENLIWEYNPVKEMTVAEVEAALGYKVKIVR